MRHLLKQHRVTKVLCSTLCVLSASVAVIVLTVGTLHCAQPLAQPQLSTATNLRPWSTAHKRTVESDGLFEALADAKIVILGELHDNALHHQLRAQIVAEIAKRRLTAKPGAVLPAAIFEHVTKDRQSDLDDVASAAASSTLPDTVDAFFRAANWEKRGWPDHAKFRPLVGAVLTAGLPLYAGDVPRKTIRRVAMAGPDQLTPAERTRLKLDISLGEISTEAALDEIEAVHCGLMPRSALEPMAFAQRLRDATLADVTLAATDWQGAAILFAGNGHVRKDRGVPWYLAARGMKNVVTVMFKERDRSRTGRDAAKSPNDNNSVDAVSPQATISDYVIWTEPLKRPDPCLEMRKKYGKTKR